jgi:hypothetical protein
MRTWLCLILAPAIGCATAQPYQAKVDVYGVQAAAPRDLSGVTITAEMVTHQNISRFGQLRAQTTWKQVDNSMAVSHAGGSSAASAFVNHTEILTLGPLPVLAVAIKNSGRQAVRFDRAQIELADGAGHTYKAVFDVAELQGRFSADVTGTHPGFPPEILESLHNNISQIPWVTLATTVPAGAAWTGFVAFDHPVHDADEFNKFMQNAQSLTVTLRNLTLDGTPIDPVAFSFPRQTVPTTLTCPGDVKPPSLVSCKAS